MPLPLIAAAAAPIVKTLLANGMSILAGAVMSKGKEWVEDKTGLRLDAVPNMTPEQLIAVKQIEFEKEELLVNAQLEGRKLDIQEVLAYLADVDSARKREIEIATSERAPLLNKIIAPILALIIVVGGGTMLWFSDDLDVRMAVVSLITLVLGYYFGTSMGSTKSQQLFRDMVKRDGTPR